MFQWFSVAWVIRLALLLLAFALLVWLVMAGVYHTGLLILSKWLLWTGAEVFLFGVGLLLLLGVGLLLKSLWRALREYCSKRAHLLRRLAFGELQKARHLQKMAGHRQQFLYLTEFKRKRMLRADTLKQSQQLATHIQRHLKKSRPHIPQPVYPQLQMQLKLFARQKNVAGLLKLQQQIMAYGNPYETESQTVGNRFS